MNVWTKRLLILVSVGGGYCGAVFMFLLFPQVGKNIAGYFLITAMIATFAFGVFAGMRFIEDEAMGLRLLRWFFGIQVPILSSPIVAYQLCSGFGINLTWIENRVTVFFRFGSEMGVWILQDRPWGLGVNAFALAMLLWTHRLIDENRKRPNKPLQPTPGSATPPAGAGVAPDPSVADL